MSLELLELIAAIVLFLGLAGYAIFGGADFGGGVWTALAFGPRAHEVRQMIFRAMGPVWETNHVWLILVLVTLWTVFPVVFSALFQALFLPLTIALLGIVFRGAAFAFRHFGSEEGSELPATGFVFSVASIVTPFAMGVCVGAVIDGGVPVGEPAPGMFEAWLQPFSLLCGLIALAICAFLTPFYMLARPLGSLLHEFRRLALIGSLALGGLTALAIPVAAGAAPDFFDGLTRPLPIALVLAAVAGGCLSLLVLYRRLYVYAPVVAAGTVVLVMAAWATAQYPYIVMPDVRIEDTVAGRGTLEAFLIALPLGSLVLVPSLWFLFSMFAVSTPRENE